MQCYFFTYNINEKQENSYKELKPYLFNPSVHSLCFRVPSIIINMTHNQWLVSLLQAGELISEASDPLEGQPVWHPVIIHCRCDHHRRVRLVDNDIELNVIAQFRYIKIQPKTIDLSMRLVGITTEFVGFIPTSLVLRSIVLG